MSNDITDGDGHTRDDAQLTTPEYAALGGALLAIGGTLLPWRITAEGTTVGLEANGFVAILLGFAILAVVGVVQGTRTSGRVAIGAGALIALLAGHWIGLVSGLSTAGAGVYLTLLGGLVALGGGAMRLRRDG